MIADDVLKQDFSAVWWKEIKDLREEEGVPKAALDDWEVCRGLWAIHIERGAPGRKVDKVDGDDGVKPADGEGQSNRPGASVN